MYKTFIAAALALGIGANAWAAEVNQSAGAAEDSKEKSAVTEEVAGDADAACDKGASDAGISKSAGAEEIAEETADGESAGGKDSFHEEDGLAAEEEYGMEKEEPVVKKRSKNETGEPLPIKLTADHAEYDNVSGDFYASGNVVVKQGKETLLTTYAVGNMKTGDIWLEQGGTLVEPNSRMNGQWAHYNFNTKTGEIKELSGKGDRDYFNAPHATVYPDRMVVDQGGTSTRCPAVKHTPCLLIKAKTFEIYPGEMMVANDVQVFVKGKHVYSRDKWVNRFGDESESKIMPRFGYDGSDNGYYAKLDLQLPLSNKTIVDSELAYYSKAHYKPVYNVTHNERNFKISYMYGWDEDDDVWYKKENTWRFDYKRHHIIDGLPLSYSGYYEYGLWQRENRKYKSWHKEYALYLYHDPIYLFNSKNTVLNLYTGKKWVNESYTGDTISSNIYDVTLRQKLGSKWSTAATYHREDKTSKLFNIGQPDMAKELRNVLSYRPDDRNTFSIVNRYDLGKHENYETYYRWLHRFCCWALEFVYEKHDYEDDNKFMVNYYFYNY